MMAMAAGLRALCLNYGGIIVVTCSLGLLLTFSPLGDGFLRFGYDILFVLRPDRNPGDLVIVFLDEKSHRELQQPDDRIWDRALHGRLLDRLTEGGARLVFFDILFNLESSDTKADEAFSEALARNGATILGASFKTEKNTGVVERSVLPPVKQFRDTALDWGLLLLDPLDSDLGIRRFNGGIDSDATATWKAASLLRPDLELEYGSRLTLRWLNPIGPPGTVPSVSFSQAILKEGVPAGYFRDKTVFVGGKYATGSTGEAKDSFRTPYSLLGHPFATGVELHTTIFENLGGRDWIERLSVGLEFLIVLLFGIVASVLIAVARPWQGVGICLLLIVVSVVPTFYATWELNLFFNWLVPVCAQIPVAFVLSTARRYYVERRSRRHLADSFSTYLSPVMVDRIGEGTLKPDVGGEIAEVTVMFSDLKGFTSISESSDPGEIAHVLNTYFEITTAGILDSNGTIIKYIGDAVFAIWGAPVADAEQADHAVDSACRMIEDSSTRKIYGHSLRTRIGISSGPCFVGNLGSKLRVDYTAIGDTVNLAARLEPFNKVMGTDILISETTFEKLKGNYVIRSLGKFKLAGKDIAIPVYEVLTGHSEEPHWLASFLGALQAFLDREFTSAARLFDETNRMRSGDDGPSQFYREKSLEFEKDPPGEYWEGEIQILTK